MKNKLLLWLVVTLVLGALLGTAFARFTPGQSVNYGTSSFQLGADPCATSGIAKSSVVIALSSATTTQLVAISGTTKIYVCGYNFTMVGAAETIAFEYGTGSSCGTGTTALTGAMADGTASDIAVSYGGTAGTIMSTPAGQALCAVTTGTVGIQGIVTFVQQ